MKVCLSYFFVCSRGNGDNMKVCIFVNVNVCIRDTHTHSFWPHCLYVPAAACLRYTLHSDSPFHPNAACALSSYVHRAHRGAVTAWQRMLNNMIKWYRIAIEWGSGGVGAHERYVAPPHPRPTHPSVCVRCMCVRACIRVSACTWIGFM